VYSLYNKSENFEEVAMKVFDYQKQRNKIYSEYLSLLPTRLNNPKNFQEIPHIPISAFKKYKIKTGNWSEELQFVSSGTSQHPTNSIHLIRSSEWYLQNAQKAFEMHFGKVSDYCFLALLPHYLERGNSSLVYMVNHFIKESNYPQSAFYLHDYQALFSTLNACSEKQIPTILFGVSYALLDFFKAYYVNFPELIIMDTGGMKGRNKELTKQELYENYKKGCNTHRFCSEYGMTELLSQAYALDCSNYRLPPTMKISARELNDPFATAKNGKAGQAFVTDLANIDTCAFIATDDLILSNNNGTFQVLGRMDHSEIRGCNLLVS